MAKKGRKKLPAHEVINVTLFAEEFKEVQGMATYPRNKFFRFLVRKHFGLCLHGVTSVDWQNDGIQKCELCGVENPENFAEFFKPSENET